MRLLLTAVICILLICSVTGMPKGINSRQTRGAPPSMSNAKVANSHGPSSWLSNTLSFVTSVKDDVFDDVTDLVENVANDVINISDEFIDGLVGSTGEQFDEILNQLGSKKHSFFENLVVDDHISSHVATKFANLTQKYLSQYGYASASSANDESRISNMINFKDAITNFQRMAGIPQTGIMNEETTRYMSMPRCGVEDTTGAENMDAGAYKVDSKYVSKQHQRKRRRKKKARRNKKKSKSRSKRYALEGGKWNKKVLTYSIENYTPDMTESHVDQDIKSAFEVWANETQLSFSKVSSGADIKISFGVGNHGDPYPFDGKGGTLAHAFFPTDGRAHFDDQERFSHKGEATNLMIVAAHEFGHALGLSHSNVQNSLMAPFYQGYDPNFNLHDDDIRAIQQLYGKGVEREAERPKNPPTRAPKPGKPTKKPNVDEPDVCRTTVDAMLEIRNYTSRGVKYHTFAFKNAYYYEIDDYGVMPNYPKKISRKWKGMAGNMNAAVYSPRDGKTYFFKGDRVWRYSGTKLDRGFPFNLTRLGYKKSFTAAFVWGRNGQIILMRKKKFYIFSETLVDNAVRGSYPRRGYSPREYSNSYFEGIPDNVDAALRWKNGKSYFFKDNQYWRFNDTYREVDKHYPKKVNVEWMGCSKSAGKLNDKGNNTSKGKGKKSKKGKKKNKSKPKASSRRLHSRPTARTSRVLLARLEEAPIQKGH